MAGVLAVAGLMAGLTIAGAVALRGPTPRAKPAATVLPPCYSSAAQGSYAHGGSNPDAGLTDAQRNLLYETLGKRADACHLAWRANLDVTKLNLANLPHVEKSPAQVPPLPSLEQATAKADLIAVVTVNSIVIGKGPDANSTYADVAVQQMVKGLPGATLRVRQGSSLEPDPAGRPLVLDDLDAPLLTPGEAVILFLVGDLAGGTPYIQGSTGMYFLSSGRVTALPTNPFATRVNGLSEERFLAAVLGHP